MTDDMKLRPDEFAAMAAQLPRMPSFARIALCDLNPDFARWLENPPPTPSAPAVALAAPTETEEAA